MGSGTLEQMRGTHWRFERHFKAVEDKVTRLYGTLGKVVEDRAPNAGQRLLDLESFQARFQSAFISFIDEQTRDGRGG